MSRTALTTALAVVILAIWFWLLLEARRSPDSREIFNTVNPIALAAATFLFTYPVLMERRNRKNRRDDEEDQDDEA